MIKKTVVNNQTGYTLVETMMALAISGFLLFSVSRVLSTQQKAYVLQEHVVDAQEGLRIATTLMNREVRMAGYDPTGTANARIVSADEHAIRLTSDFNGDGDTGDENEDVTYSIYTSAGIKKLGRKSGIGNNNPVLEYVESVDLVYRMADGTLLPSPVADPSVIKKIEIRLSVRTAQADPKYPKNGGYRTRTLTTNISLRN